MASNTPKAPLNGTNGTIANVSMDAVLAAQSMENRATQLETQVSKNALSDDRKHRAFFVAGVASILVGVVCYFASGIYGMKMRYPHLFAWYEGMRRDKVQGAGRHDFSLYQVCTAANFAAAQQLFNLLLVWKDLHPAAANFLLFTIEYFDEKAKKDPKKRLTALHWAGSGAQTGFEKLTGPTGWASTGCATATLEQKKETLIANWNRSADENIWYHMLPQPVDASSKRAFLSVPMIAELYSDSATTGGAASACDPESFRESKLGLLFDGGLCNVAFYEGTKANEDSADLFNDYFAVHDNPNAYESCNGAAAAGAVQGAMSGGMSGLMFLQMAEGALPGPVGILTKLAGAGVVAGGMAAASGATSAAAAQARCRRSGGET